MQIKRKKETDDTSLRDTTMDNSYSTLSFVVTITSSSFIVEKKKNW